MSLRAVILVLMCIALVCSALGVVYTKHQTRRMFVELSRLQTERDAMNVDWGRLQLEQSTLTTHGRIEAIAHGKLAMSIPPQETVVIVGR